MLALITRVAFLKIGNELLECGCGLILRTCSYGRVLKACRSTSSNASRRGFKNSLCD
jgi:hypothetical protein